MRSKMHHLLLPILGAATLAAGAVLAAPVCEGDYIAAVNGVKNPVQGKVTGVPNPYRRQPVKVTVQDCGRALTIDGDGAMTLSQVANRPEQYISQQQGMTAVFDVWSPDRLTGQVLMPGVSGSVIYELTLVDGHTPDMTGCDAPEDDAADEDRLTVDPTLRREVIGTVAARLDIPRDVAGRYISAARSAAKTRQSDKGVTEIMPGEPGCPIELTGVKTCRVFPPDITTIVEANLLLDAEGRLLPVTTDGSATQRVRVDDPGSGDLCAQERTLPPADRRLRFKFLAIEEDGINDVQAMLFDARTHRATRAHYAEGGQKGAKGRAAAVDEAYEAVGAPVTGRHDLP